MSLLLLCSWTFNKTAELWATSTRFAEGVYRLWLNDGIWFITPDGAFANSNDFTIGDVKWHYSNNLILNILDTETKRIPFLSCVFKSGDTVVSIDEFLEQTRASAGTPFPVLMAAFCIYSKTLYNWRELEFEAYTRNGDTLKFIGYEGPFTETAVNNDIVRPVPSNETEAYVETLDNTEEYGETLDSTHGKYIESKEDEDIKALDSINESTEDHMSQVD